MRPASVQLPLAPLVSALPDDPRRAIDRVAHAGFRFVQLSATQQGMRPRDLDQSARRDLLAVLRRHELALAGIDLWIPVEHFLDEANISRAVDATVATIVLAGDLGRVPVSMNLPAAAGDESNGEVVAVLGAITGAAQQHGVAIANHATPPRVAPEGPIGLGIDPPAWLAQGLDPADAVSTHADRLVSARLCDLNAAGMRCAIGEPNGRLDVTAYGVALSVAGFHRPLVIDARQWPHPWAGVQRTAETWAACVGVP